jgi:hypothetical protein
MDNGNKNIVCVEMLENYAMQMQKLLTPKKDEVGIVVKTPLEKEVVWDAVEFLNMYQANQLKALRDAFE